MRGVRRCFGDGGQWLVAKVRYCESEEGVALSTSLFPDLIADGRQCRHWLVEVHNSSIVDLNREGELKYLTVRIS